MAAAVADYRPGTVSDTKIKKSAGSDDAPVLHLVRTVDVLAAVSHHRPHPDLLVVGFAAETGDSAGDVRHHAEAKLASKGCDLLVVNDVSAGAVFGSDRNAVVVLAPQPDGPAVEVASTPTVDKRVVADVVLDAVVHRLGAPRPTAAASP